MSVPPGDNNSIPTIWDRASNEVESIFDRTWESLRQRAGMVRLVVHDALMICSDTIPPATVNKLIVSPLRAKVEGKPLAHIKDNVRDTNIKPWPCKCKKRPAGNDFLPCDYKPAGPWSPGVKTYLVEGALPGTNAQAQRVMQDLMNQGFTREQAAGIVGNIMVESDNFRAYAEYGGGGGRGWIQWTGPRARAFESWAAGQNLAPTSYEANFGYLMHEMGGAAGNHWTGGYSLNGLRQQTTANGAAEYFMRGYERPGVPHLDRRQANARQLAGTAKEPAIPETATLKCTYGGTISIIDPGQNSKWADPNEAREHVPLPRPRPTR